MRFASLFVLLALSLGVYCNAQIVPVVTLQSESGSKVELLFNENALTGLKKTLPTYLITINYDSLGVPTVNAPSFLAGYVGQGFACAKARLFQMDVLRRIANGTASAALGSSYVASDRFLRELGVYRDVALDWAALQKNVQDRLKAYAAGVQLFISSRSYWSIQYASLGLTPAPWTAMEPLLIGRLVAVNFLDDWDQEIVRLGYYSALGNNYVQFFQADTQATPDIMFTADDLSIFPVNGSRSSTGANPAFQTETHRGARLVEAEVEPALQSATHRDGEVEANIRKHTAHLDQHDIDPAKCKVPEFVEVLKKLVGGLGSNAVSVSRRLTASGKETLMFMDPHLAANDLGERMWELGLVIKGRFAHGWTFPGVPGIAVGCNRAYCHSQTLGYTDSSDLFLETLNPANANQYFYNNVPQDMVLRSETIEIRGAASYTFVARETRNGPVIDSVASTVLPSTATFSLRFPFYGKVLSAASGVATAWEVDRELDYIQLFAENAGFSTNLNVASRKNRIYWALTGTLPIRNPASGYGTFPPLPLNGNQADTYAIIGYVPREQRPFVQDPAIGFIVSCNQRQTPVAFPYYISFVFGDRGRALRISELITTGPKLDLARMKAIQTDILSNLARELLPRFVAVPTCYASPGVVNTAAEAIRSVLQGFNYVFSTDSIAATAATHTFSMVAYAFDSGANLQFQDFTNLLRRFTAAPNSAIWDNPSTATVETFNDGACSAMAGAWSLMQSTCGSVTSASCAWGNLHLYTTGCFSNPSSATCFKFGGITGGFDTVNVAAPARFSSKNPTGNLWARNVPIFRIAASMTRTSLRLDGVSSISNTGDPTSPLYAAEVPLYLTSQYKTIFDGQL